MPDYTPDTLRRDWPPKQIESTGRILSIEAREVDAVKHIREELAKIESKLRTLNRTLAATYCANAVILLEDDFAACRLQRDLKILRDET